MDSLLRGALGRRELEHEEEMAEELEHSKCRHCRRILRLAPHRKSGIHPWCASAEAGEGGKAAHARAVANG